MFDRSYASTKFKEFVDGKRNVGDEFYGPNGEVVIKKFETTLSGDPRKHVVLNELSDRGSVDVILREQSDGNDGHEVIYKKYANHDVPSYNAYPVRDRLDDNTNELRQGTKEDEKIVKEVLYRHTQWYRSMKPLTW